MDLDEAFDLISGCGLTHSDCLFLIRLGLEGLELLQEESCFSLVEDMNVGEDEPKCPKCGFPMHISKDICMSCKEDED